MEITLGITAIKEDMILKSHLELETEENLDKKWYARVDEDKEDELDRAIMNAGADLEALCWRWIEATYVQAEDDALEASNLVFNLNFSRRRTAEKAKQLASAMHAYIVDDALAKFYDTVEAQDLSEQHAKNAQAQAQVITHIIYSKLPPIV